MTVGTPKLQVAAFVFTQGRRPNTLRRVLRAVASQRVPEGFEVRRYLVINAVSGEGFPWDDADDTGTGCPIRRMASEHGFEVLPAPLPGLACARNRALQHANDFGYHFTYFTDDDCIPRRDALRALLERWQESGAAGVRGTITYVRLKRKGFNRFNPICTCGPNILINMRTVRQLGVWYDSDFNFSGGEDGAFWHDAEMRHAYVARTHRARAIEPLAQRQRLWGFLRWHYVIGASNGYFARKRASVKTMTWADYLIPFAVAFGLQQPYLDAKRGRAMLRLVGFPYVMGYIVGRYISRPGYYKEARHGG